MRARELQDREFLYGHKACPGCALGIVGRLAMKVLGERTMVVLPASCMSSVTTVYPHMSYFTPSMTSAFPAAGAVLNGLAAGFAAQGMHDVQAVAFAGDGGTADIGLQALSGAIEQGRNFIYICYDNEAYMNTGIQRSGLTPMGAATTTTPAGSRAFGETTQKKNMFEIAMAHRIPYAACASTSYADDLVRKIEKARDIKGPAFLHVMAPCPTGWGFDPADTVEIGRLAVRAGMWYLAEYEDGRVRVNQYAKAPVDIRDYMLRQKRFRHLTEEQLGMIAELRDRELARVAKWSEEEQG